MQTHILSSNRQTQTGTTQGALTRSISTPETVEHLNGLILRQTDTVVTHRNAQVRGVRAHVHVNRSGFAVLNRVVQQVTQHTLNTHTVHIHHDALMARMHVQLRVRTLQVRQSLLQNIRQHTHEVFSVDGQHCATGIETRNFQQVSKHRLETIHLIMQKLHSATQRPVHIPTRIVQKLSTQTHRRQRSTQLMRHVRHKALLQSRQALQLNNLLLQRISHQVERITQTRRLMLTIHRHTLIQVTGSQLLRRNSGLRNRADHKTSHNPHHRKHHSKQRTETTKKNKVNMRNRGGRIRHIVHKEQTIIRVLRNRNMGANNKHRIGTLTVIFNSSHRRRLPENTFFTTNSFFKIIRNARRVQRIITTLLRNKALFTLAFQRHKNPISLTRATRVQDGQSTAHVTANLAVTTSLRGVQHTLNVTETTLRFRQCLRLLILKKTRRNLARQGPTHHQEAQEHHDARSSQSTELQRFLPQTLSALHQAPTRLLRLTRLGSAGTRRGGGYRLRRQSAVLVARLRNRQSGYPFAYE